MPVDKFGRMSDTKTKDTGVSLTYINNNYVRSDGETPLTGSLNMRGNTLYNVADPVNPQDVVTKVYVDNTKGSGVIGRKTGNGVSIKENLDFLGKQRIKNLPDPVGGHDAVTKEYVDEKDAVTKKYVDDKTKNLFIDENDNIAFGLNVDMEGNQILGLPQPATDQEPATKKYVDDLQIYKIDKRGNIKFDRNINVGNNKIFALKDPKKDYEATNKKYVDETIDKRIQEEKDNFLPKDPATKEYVDEAIRGIAGGDVLVSKEGVFIKENGHYRATAPLDIDNQKMENLPDPVDGQDAVNKKYIDGIVENLTLKQGLIRENGGFNLVDSYINMNFNNVRNLGLPQNENDAVPKRFIDEEIKTTLKRVQNQLKELNQLVSVCGSCYEYLKYGDYPFTFGGPILNGKLRELDKLNGFLVPANGVLKHFITFSSGLVLDVPGVKNAQDLVFLNNKPIIDLYGKPDSLLKLFTLIKIEQEGEEEELGGIYFKLTDITIDANNMYRATNVYKFIIAEKLKNKEENFICSVNQGDIINIRSEFGETKLDDDTRPHVSILVRSKNNPVTKFVTKEMFSLHLATLTFLFKETSFPNVLDEIDVIV